VIFATHVMLGTVNISRASWTFHERAAIREMDLHQQGLRIQTRPPVDPHTEGDSHHVAVVAATGMSVAAAAEHPMPMTATCSDPGADQEDQGAIRTSSAMIEISTGEMIVTGTEDSTDEMTTGDLIEMIGIETLTGTNAMLSLLGPSVFLVVVPMADTPREARLLPPHPLLRSLPGTCRPLEDHPSFPISLQDENSAENTRSQILVLSHLETGLIVPARLLHHKHRKYRRLVQWCLYALRLLSIHQLPMYGGHRNQRLSRHQPHLQLPAVPLRPPSHHLRHHEPNWQDLLRLGPRHHDRPICLRERPRM
jgi:hypothetical protein